MRNVTAALLVTLSLGGCGGGGSPLDEREDPVVALGTLLIQRNFSFSAVASDMRPFVGLGADPEPTVALFDTLTLTEADVGRTFVIASSADDAEFAVFAALLTNGVDDRLGVVVRADPGGSQFSRLESVLLQGAAGGSLAPDFVGSTISRIELRVEALSLDTPGQDLQGDGDWTDVEATLRIVFFGVRG